MEPEKLKKSALEHAREARIQHENFERTYRDGTYETIALIARTVAHFEKDDHDYQTLLQEPFFAERSKKAGRKRDTTNKFYMLGRYICDARTREKEKLVNVYANIARYLVQQNISPDEIPKAITEGGGLKDVAKIAADDRKNKILIFEDETWEGLVALKIWVSPKHLDRAMSVNIDQEVELKFKRVDDLYNFKQFVSVKLKSVDPDLN